MSVRENTVTITLEVPTEWVKGLTDDKTSLLEIFQMGLTEYKIRRALNLYRGGAGSLAYVAELVGLPRRVLLEEARKYGLEPDYEDESVREDLFQ